MEGRGEFRLGCARPGNALDAASPRRMSHRRYGKPVRHDYKPFPLAAHLEPIRTMASSFRHSFFSSPSFLPRAVATSMSLSRLATMPSLLLSCCANASTEGLKVDLNCIVSPHFVTSYIVLRIIYNVRKNEDWLEILYLLLCLLCLLFWFLFFI